MAHQGWRQRAAYVAVMFAGVASLATSYGGTGPAPEEVSLEGTLLVAKDAAASQRFRVRTTGPWTLVVAELLVDGGGPIEIHAMLVPDEPRLFGNTQSSRIFELGSKPGAKVALAQPPCALSEQCEATKAVGLPDYRFALRLEGATTDVTVRYRIVASTVAEFEEDDFGLELLAE
jgi:hypothetical protein